MISLSNAVHKKPTFEKTADYELPRNVSEWNEEILKRFYEEVTFLPKEIGIDVVVKDVNENKGYAKGSIVAFFANKKINFPIIIKNFKLSPFDVFAHDSGSETVYYPANIDNIKKVLVSNEIATLENYWGKGNPAPGTKPVSGIYPKQSINIWDAPADRMYPPFSKMSSWPFLAKKEDLEKLAIQMEAEPDVNESFIDNTGDLVGNIIELKDNKKEIISDDQKSGVLDLNNVIKAKQALTVIDSEFIDVDKLTPIQAPSVCEIRTYQYPSMEDFMESGYGISERFLATKIGKAIQGIVLDYKDNFDNGGESVQMSDGEKGKELRNRRNQIFFSLNGKYLSEFMDWNKTGIGFYGSSILETPGILEKAIKMLADNTTDDLINQNEQNMHDGSDKLFKAINIMEQGKRMDSYSFVGSCPCAKLRVIYGAGNCWECMGFNGNYRKYRVNNTNIYVSSETVVIPANVASVQKVESVNDPVYKMVIGKVENIFLIPEGSLVFNAEYMKNLDPDDIMRPGKPIQKIYEDAEINKVSVYIDSEKDKGIGYRIDGKSFEPLKKIAGVGNRVLTTNEALFALNSMGVEKTASRNILKMAVNKYANQQETNKNVVVYGVRNDYVNASIFKEREKTAKIRGIFKNYIEGLRKDLIKEASILQDPEAVDVVLSLNFINEDSVGGYIENINEMKRINSELAKMLIASRMGLADIDESALKKSIEGLSSVIKGLEDVKMAVEDK